MGCTGHDWNLPTRPRTGFKSKRLQDDGEKSRSHLFAGGNDGIVFPRIMKERGFLDPGDKLVGGAGHGGYDDGNVVAAIDLTLDVKRHVANPLDVGDGRPTEFHYNNSHNPRRPASLKSR